MTIGSFFTKALDYISAPLSQPRTTFTQGLTAGAKAVETSRAGVRAGTQSGLKVIGTTLGTTALAAGAVLAGAGAAGGAAGIAARSTAVSLGKSLVPKTVGGAVKTAILAPLAAGVLLSSPKTTKAITEAPSSFYNFGQNVGELIENPSIANVKTTFTENPLIAGGIAAALAALGVKTITGVAGVVSSARNTQALQELTASPPNFYPVPVPAQTPSGAEVVAAVSSQPAPSVKPKKKTTKKKAKPKKKTTKKKTKAKPKPKKTTKKKAKPKKKTTKKKTRRSKKKSKSIKTKRSN